MKFIKKHKVGLIVLVVCIILIVLMLFAIKNAFFANVSESKYGTRLDGIENYPLSSTLSEDISSIYSSDKSVGSANVTVEGRIIYITIDFVKSIKVDTAKSTAIKALDVIGEENLKFYEVQFILTYSGEEENTNFPVFGSKNVNSLKVVW